MARDSNGSVNKYFPPGWDPSKGSVNKFQGVHPLRERAKKISEGILVIRFEMPYNVRCSSCDSHVGKGVRYNAEKKCVGKYFSTKIWNFRMKCHLCEGFFEVQTNPKDCEYDLVSGAERVKEEYDAAANETIELMSTEEKQALASDPFYKLEHGKGEAEKVAVIKPVLTALIEVADTHRKDDYSMSSRMRRTFREEKKAQAKETLRKDNEADALGYSFHLLDPSQADARGAASFLSGSAAKAAASAAAASAPFGKLDAFRADRAQKRAAMQMSSIFDAPPAAAAHAARKALKQPQQPQQQRQQQPASYLRMKPSLSSSSAKDAHLLLSAKAKRLKIPSVNHRMFKAPAAAAAAPLRGLGEQGRGTVGLQLMQGALLKKKGVVNMHHKQQPGGTGSAAATSISGSAGKAPAQPAAKSRPQLLDASYLSDD